MKLKYSRLKLVAILILLMLCVWLGYAAWVGQFSSRRSFLGLILLIIAPFGAIYQLRYLVSPEVLTFDGAGLTAHGFFGSRKAAWNSVEGVRTETYGKSDEPTHLVVFGPFGVFGKMRIHLKMLSGDVRSASAILDAIEQARQVGFPKRRTKKREVAPPSQPVPAAAGFGRKRT